MGLSQTLNRTNEYKQLVTEKFDLVREFDNTLESTTGGIMQRTSILKRINTINNTIYKKGHTAQKKFNGHKYGVFCRGCSRHIILNRKTLDNMCKRRNLTEHQARSSYHCRRCRKKIIADKIADKIKRGENHGRMAVQS